MSPSHVTPNILSLPFNPFSLEWQLVKEEIERGFLESLGSVPTGLWLGTGGLYPTLVLNQSSLPPGVEGLAMLAGEPRLGMDSPPPGVAGEVRECSLDSMDPPWLAGEPPSPSDP